MTKTKFNQLIQLNPHGQLEINTTGNGIDSFNWFYITYTTKDSINHVKGSYTPWDTTTMSVIQLLSGVNLKGNESLTSLDRKHEEVKAKVDRAYAKYVKWRKETSEASAKP